MVPSGSNTLWGRAVGTAMGGGSVSVTGRDGAVPARICASKQESEREQPLGLLFIAVPLEVGTGVFNTVLLGAGFRAGYRYLPTEQRRGSSSYSFLIPTSVTIKVQNA